MKEPTQPQVAFVGSYVPRHCGIATFTHDIAGAVANVSGGTPLGNSDSVKIVAVSDRFGAYRYPSEVILEINQHRRDEYRDAAESLNAGRTEVVCLQHEYGLFGGEAGEYVLDLLERLRKPLVTTLHTVLEEPSRSQREILSRICGLSSSVVVMADRAFNLLRDIYDVPEAQIRLIPHGVPDVPLGETEPFKRFLGLEGRAMVFTFGLLSPGKGIEVMLDALARVVPDHPEVAYVVLGVTHPGVVRESGEQYRLGLESRAVELGIERNVEFHNRYASISDLCDYLRAADIYVTPYRSRQQITSGTLAYALAAGKPIISTPYWYAEELLAEGRGRLFDFGDSEQLARHLNELLSDTKLRRRIAETAYAYGRQMVWPRVARRYVETFAESGVGFPERLARRKREQSVLLRMTLPSPRLDHLFNLTDDTGLFQHATYATPNRAHGYCTDDNARALIVATMAWSLFRDESVLKYLNNYLSFMHYSLPAGGSRFRNFMTYDRRWHDQDGGDDCQGRSLWALAFLVAHSSDRTHIDLAGELFRIGMSQVQALTSPRAWALTMLGLHYYRRQFGDDKQMEDTFHTLADRLEDAFAKRANDEWRWCEDVVTYENGRLPQALIIAGFTLGRSGLVDRGISVLQWLLDLQRGEAGHLSVIGNHGWHAHSGQRAKFDQQPVEPAALIGACKAAYRATEDRKWLSEMRRCFEWYLGRNDAGEPLVDYKTRGCRDGIAEHGVNLNQGAEATVSWLLSLLIMHEMQTGEPPQVG